MDGWKIKFPLGWPIFSGKLLVSGRMTFYKFLDMKTIAFLFSVQIEEGFQTTGISQIIFGPAIVGASHCFLFACFMSFVST